jgi:3-oxoacyl-[acyl-carrier-protein] synthase-3
LEAVGGAQTGHLGPKSVPNFRPPAREEGMEIRDKTLRSGSVPGGLVSPQVPQKMGSQGWVYARCNLHNLAKRVLRNHIFSLPTAVLQPIELEVDFGPNSYRFLAFPILEGSQVAEYRLLASKILGTGRYTPEKSLTNHDLEQMVDTNDAWIVERTGIRARSIAAPEQVTTDLAYEAAQKALEAAQTTPSEIDMIIFATVTPDQPMPSAGCVLQHKLGCRNIMAFDLSAACSGFVYGMSVAHQFLQTGHYKKILVVGAEVLSRIVNYEDRETCILFGDGAGAMVLGATAHDDPSQILSCHMHADGSLGELFVLPAGGSAEPFSQKVVDGKLQYVRMKGREIFKHAVRTMSLTCEEALSANNISKNEVDWVIPHQANKRIMDAVAKTFGIPEDRVISNLEYTGNTSAASVPMAFDTAVRDGRIQRGQTVLLTAFGAGLTSGSILLRY